MDVFQVDVSIRNNRRNDFYSVRFQEGAFIPETVVKTGQADVLAKATACGRKVVVTQKHPVTTAVFIVANDNPVGGLTADSDIVTCA